jgi:hypothetical protein
VNIISLSEFLTIYPEFTGNNEIENNRLIKNHNLMVVAKKMFVAYNNKDMLLRICGLLDGPEPVLLITGRGEKKNVRDRKLIFYRVFHVEKENRNPRKRRLENNILENDANNQHQKNRKRYYISKSSLKSFENSDNIEEKNNNKKEFEVIEGLLLLNNNK